MLRIAEEPRGVNYNALLDYTLGKFPMFLLVFRPEDLSLNNHGEHTKSRLSEFIIREEKSFKWPGTQIFTDEEATIYYYKIQYGSIHILKDVAEGLYDWQQPDLLEDLCILRQDETPWLVSIAHESEAYLDITQEEVVHLGKQLPDLVISNNSNAKT